MVSESFPVDGVDGFTISDWSEYNASSDGPTELYTADALSMSLVDAGSVVRLGAGAQNAYVSINGYRLRIPAGQTHDLTCPTPSSGSVTYYVVAYYDPLLNVRNADQSAPKPLGACRFGLYSSSDVGSALAGKPYVLLKAITRTAGQALSVAVVTDFMRYLGGPTMEWSVTPGDPPVGQFAAPRGAIRVAPDQRKVLLRTPVAGAMAWWDVLNAGPFAFPAPSNLVANSGAPQYRIVAGTMVKCSGTLKRSSGTLSSGNDTTLGNFPVGLRPAFTERYICKTGAGKNYIEVRVNPGGDVVMTGESGVDWIDLSPLFWYCAA